jgi:hypothetical protein
MVDSLIDARQLQGVSDYETRILQSYREQARSSLEIFAWCTEVRQERFGLGVSGMVAVFAMETLVKGRTREWLWVVAGELPAAYFSLARATCPCDALRVYCELVESWIDAVHHGTLHRDVFPLSIEPTPAAAALLGSKLRAMRSYVVPALCLPVGEEPHGEQQRGEQPQEESRTASGLSSPHDNRLVTAAVADP